jgi:Ca2+-binding EF-hand superfamily protein
MSNISGVGGFRPPPPKPPSFDTIDSNSDGALSLDEFKSGAPKGADSAKIEERFKKLDADGDGSISKAESEEAKSQADKAEQLLQSFLLTLQPSQPAKTEKASDSEDEDDPFAQIDANSDGSISSDEFKNALSSGRSSSDDLLSKLFDAIDSDHDGSVTKDETKAFQANQERRGPPPPPPPNLALSASQAYGSAYGLGTSAATGATYSAAA